MIAPGRDETDLNALDDDSFRGTIRAWIEANYPPELRNPPKRLHLRDNWPWYKALSDKGWLVPGWPREHGGLGLSARKQVIWAEELERHGCARLNDHGMTMLGPLLIRYGTEEQKNFYLPRILSGEHIWCQGYSEPGAGSDLAALRTRAVREGDEWVINGQKIWTTMASDANWCFLLVRTDASGRKQEGISFLLAPMDAPGVTVRPILNLEMHDEFCEVFFDNVRVPAANLVGNVNEGWAMAKALLGFERLFLGSPRLAAYALGQLDALGRRHGLWNDAVFREVFARLSGRLETHKALFAAFLRRIERGHPVGAEISLLKVSVTELFREITEAMLDYAGPEAGLVEPPGAKNGLNPAAQFLQARPSTIYGGSSEIQRNIIAKAVLGLPA